MTLLQEFAERLTALTLSAAESAKLDDHIYDTQRARDVGGQTPDGQALKALGLPAVAEAIGCARLTEVDDIDRASGTTPGSVAVMVAGDDAIAAAAGYEAMIRLGRAIGGQKIGYRGVWASYFCAPFAAAAAASRVMNLGATETAHALSIALTMSAGRAGPTVAGRAGRWMLIGLAAHQGTLAAKAAANGIKGDLGLLESPYLERAHALPADIGAFKTPGLVIGDVSLKPYCSAKQLLSAIRGVQQLVGKDTASVTVALPPDIARMVDHPAHPGDRLASISGGPYQLGITAKDPERLYDISRERLSEAKLDVKIVADPALDTYLPAQWPARVTVGKEEVLVLDSPGDPALPMNRAAIEAKYAAISSARR
jgi:2-methylcitrate dehydratase PrpD